MGTEYYIVDKTNKRMFWLGKGFLGRAFEEAGREGMPKDAPFRWLHDRLLGAMMDEDRSADSDDVAWLRTIAVQVWAFCQVAKWNIECRIDVSDYPDEEFYERDDGSRAYVCVASRYRQERLDPDPCAEEQARWEGEAERQ